MVLWDCLRLDLDTVTGEHFTLTPIKRGCKHFYVTFKMEAINNHLCSDGFLWGKKV